MAVPACVDAYAAAGRGPGFPRPDCPSCAGPLALIRGRQAAFDASYHAMTARKEDAVDHNEQEQVALHRWAVIAEAAGETLTAREPGLASALLHMRSDTEVGDDYA